MKVDSWIKSANYDLTFIIAPSFISIFLLVFFPNSWLWSDEMPVWGWVILVLLIDVSHVYASLYRTYFDRVIIKKHKKLLLFAPIIIFFISFLIYQKSELLFWRLAAYFAVFHFIKQQYGFLKLYTRAEGTKIIDIIMIYLACIFPVIIWHFLPSRNFNWFIPNDFLISSNPNLAEILKQFYWLILFIYFIFTILEYIKSKIFNLPKTSLILSTILTWYLGIVYFNGDMAFTMLNVVAHGVPYIALIYASESSKLQKQKGVWKFIFSRIGVPIFLLIIFLFAYIEEGFWHSFVYFDKPEIFSTFPKIIISESYIISIVIAVLSLPQLTHYFLDGYIWKRNF